MLNFNIFLEDSIKPATSEEEKRRRREKVAAWKQKLNIQFSGSVKKPTIVPFSIMGSKKTNEIITKQKLEKLDYSAAEAQIKPAIEAKSQSGDTIDGMELEDDENNSSKPNELTKTLKELNDENEVFKKPLKAEQDSENKIIEEKKPIDSQNKKIDSDPLDAFMDSISAEVNQLKKESYKKASLETNDKIYFSSQLVQTSAKSKTQNLNNGENNEDEKPLVYQDDIQQLAKMSVKKTLEVVDHSRMVYNDFRKEFYVQVPDIEKMSEEEVNIFRKQLDGIRIRGKDCPRPIKIFAQSGLSTRILDRIKRLNYEKPTPIQAQALPAIMSGRDVIGIAKTGSGKTLAFLLPMFRHILAQPPIILGDGPIALIMAPTRELATQIHSDIREFRSATGINSCCIYGGSDISSQIADLKRGTEVVVCTPGRMIEMLSMNKGRVTNLKRVTYLVLDEADRMFDMGFEQQILRLVNNIRPTRQTVMFSATFPRNVEVAARKILNTPLEITVHGRSVVSDTINQIVEVRENNTKFKRLMELITEWYDKGSILIFSQTQDSVDSLYHNVIRSGYNCLSFHAGRDQMDRDETIEDFKRGNIKILIATSGASRGLDVSCLRLVINYDVPNHLEDYVHRVGRTGRAGASGTAVTFISPNEDQYAPDLVKALSQSNKPVPQELANLAKQFEEKTKQGLARKHTSGFEGRGYQFNEEEELLRKAAINSVQLHFGGEVAEEALASRDEDFIQEDFDDDDYIVQPNTSNPITNTTTSPLPNINGLVSNYELAKMTPLQRAAAEKFNELLMSKFSTPTQVIGPDGQIQEHFDCEIEINDFPQLVRRRVTSKDTFLEVIEATGCAITPKGVYFAPGKQTLMNERKLYLSVEGPSQEAVNIARQEIKLVLESSMSNPALRIDRPAGRYSVLDN